MSSEPSGTEASGTEPSGESLSVEASVAALRSRLATVAPFLLGSALPPMLPVTAGPLLALLADAVADEPSSARIWVLSTAVAAGYPTPSEVVAVRRGLELAAPGARSGAVMAGVALTATGVRSDTVLAEVVDTVLVDVDFCANHAHNTGIQRVVRNTVPHWDGERVLAAWSPDGSGYRRLTEAQEELVLRWCSGLPSAFAETNDAPLLIPIGATVLLPEVPSLGYIERLTAIAQFSGNRTGLIGYDAIPIVNADSMLDDESDRFSHYLAIVKHATVISGISETTAEEFRSFRSSLVAQGLSGPEVVALPLPASRPSGMTVAEASTPRERPLVLMVGSLEPRKNQLGVLSAARILWDRGLDFELLFIGGGSAWFLAGFEAQVAALAKAGRPVSIGRGLSDERLAASYAEARVFAFPSLQEGYGLPVAEALATGTPVVTTRYGSTAEIAAAGGCLLVDPRDDDAIADAIETLLVDDAVHARLVAEALARDDATWPDYATALWRQLVAGTVAPAAAAQADPAAVDVAGDTR